MVSIILSNRDRALAAIIVACLASFRQLFVKSEQSANNKQSGTSSSRTGNLLYPFRSLKMKNWWGNKSFYSSTSTSRHCTLPSSQGSAEYIVPLNTIYVKRDVAMSSDSYKKATRMPQATVQNFCYPDTPSHNER